MSEAEKTTERSIMEDIDLINAFKAGDKTAFDALVIRHKDMVFNLCYRFLGDLQDANDAAQDVFIKAFKALKRFRFESSFSTWIYRIGVNTCKNKVKSAEHRYREQTTSLDNPGPGRDGDPPMEMADESPSPTVALESKERSMIIQKAIHSLPKGKKKMIILRDMEGLSYDEIMNITGFNLGTVKSKIARARSDLRGMLRGVL
ncbi:MAG: sigma-70 family RNA polymerase sigma factor [Deltaproteobacteria bacterium]|nr:sigma-70 family RNA polymerase sigma factor [Deltaproteobacteria bacterium]